ncbi:MAG: ribonucleotide-diphosphate reductase subunit beta [Patescibacteria group bacterium]|nr:ribonucleotide-diphosphate reductase subunit beta [Patescibacteria group bacterium]
MTEEAKTAKDASALFPWEASERTRLTLHPIRYPDLWKFRKNLEALHWVPEEVDRSKDRADWKKMPEEQKRPARFTMGLFATFDNVVFKNIPNFKKRVNCLEAQGFYAAAENQEVTHIESYGMQIEGIAEDEREFLEILQMVKNTTEIANVIKWAEHWMNETLPFGESYIAFAAVEGVMFSGFFCILQWLREKNLLPGVTAFNSFIARDEGEHCRFASHVIRKHLLARPTLKRVRAIFKSGIDAVATLITSALSTPLPDLNAGLVVQYVQFQAVAVADRMGYAMTRVENPLKWMDKMDMNEVSKKNFFEVPPTEYHADADDASKWEVDESEIVQD